jgi:protein TonB
MGYQALLFCPDEKTARTVTLVLSELEFSVEACTEPFAAVKKLMGQHFDAVVVDCDNEQNATLLFKSARNSTSNQTSLAVAVVEGQAGVAKAFRIGANLVLTKPINIEQAKGTLRVARGLLRKSDPTKPAATGAVPPSPVAGVPSKPVPASPTAPKPAPLKPISAAKPSAAAPPLAKPVVPPPVSTAQPAWPAAQAANPTPAEQDEPVLDIDAEEPAARSIPAAQAEKLSVPPPSAPTRPAFGIGSAVTSGGAASAPAKKIEETQAPEKKPETAAAAALFEKPAEAAPAGSPTLVGSAPSFTFGGASAEPESQGGSKKFLIIGVAAVVVVAAAYVGLTQFQSHKPAAPATQIASTPAPVVPQQSKPASVPASPAATAPAPSSAAPSAATTNEAPSDQAQDDTDSAQPEIALHSAPSSSKKPSTPAASSKAAEAAAPTAAPMVVKGGKGPAAQTKAAADDAAPSLIGMATPGAGAPLNIVPTGNTGVTPVLQTLNVSQGVSQGLLIKKVAPTYPQSALRLRIEGTVQLLATVSKEGSITHVKVLSGDSQLTRAASDAVKQWKYKPYLLNGEPVEIQTQVTVNFKLPQ